MDLQIEVGDRALVLSLGFLDCGHLESCPRMSNHSRADTVVSQWTCRHVCGRTSRKGQRRHRRLDLSFDHGHFTREVCCTSLFQIRRVVGCARLDDQEKVVVGRWFSSIELKK